MPVRHRSTRLPLTIRLVLLLAVAWLGVTVAPSAAWADAPPVEDETTETTTELDDPGQPGVEPTTTDDTEASDGSGAATVVFVVATATACAVVGMLLVRSARGSRA